MKRNIKSKLVLCIILTISVLNGITFSEFSGKYVKNNYNSKRDIISELRDASGDWDPQITLTVGDNPWSVFIGDANNDGYNDIVTANFADYTISIILWNSTSSGWNPQITKSVYHTYSAFIGDANNDGYNDIVIGNFADSSVSIFLWNSTSSDWDPQITRTVGVFPLDVYVIDVFIGDANNDGYNDIVTANGISHSVSILLWDNISSDWDPYITREVGMRAQNVFIGDANNDGYNDIATANLDDSTVSILLWNSNLEDWDPQIIKSVAGPTDVFIGDVNNDGYNDIAVVSDGSDTVSIYLWNNTLSDWDSQISRAVGIYPECMFIGDANNDGFNDIVVANGGPDTVSIILWNSISGTLDSQITRVVGSDPYGVFLGDANNDGYNDIVVANLGSGTVSILLWNPSLSTISITSPNTSSSWKINTAQYIYWDSTGIISYVRIELYKDGVFVMEIVAITPNNGSYIWNIPSELEDSTQYQIKISDVSNSPTYDFSDYFEIKQPSKGPPGIPGYDLYLLMSIICIVSIILFKNRFKLIN